MIRVESMIEIVSGVLQNRPSISAFHSIKTAPSKIKRGDLFLAFNKEKVEEAIKNGAYGIIYDGNIKISDNEIAWISVENICDSAIAILRYINIDINSLYYFVEPLIFEMAKSLLVSNIIFLDGIVEKEFDIILNSSNRNSLFFSYNMEFLDKIAPLYQQLNILDKSQITINSSKLFETSFIYREKLFEKVMLPKVFIYEFEQLLNFLEHHKMDYSTQNFHLKEHFEPVFVDKFLNLKDYGKSDKVLIFESSTKYAKAEIEYLKESAKWAKNIVISHEEIPNHDVFIFKNIHELQNILTNIQFNFALIIGESSTIVNDKNFSIKKRDKTLF